jgi:phosphatidylinositol glycan class W
MTTTTTITYKELKEEFVRGSSGTSPWEVLCICSTPAVGLFCYENLLKILVVNSSGTSNANTNINHHLLQRRLPIEIVAEIVSFWIPMLLSQTIWFDPYGKVYLLLQILTGSLILVWHRRRKRHRRIASSSSDCETLDCKRTSVSIYRGCLYVLTCLAILAVDFHVFPRTLMKTEEVGYSLMDLGAASFVVAAGWVSPRSRWFHLLYPKAEDDSSSLHHRHGWRLVPILGMGLIRLFAHKQVEYPEHVTEYGVHWNFFFTMSFLTVYSTIMMGSSLSSVQTPPGLLFPLSMLVIYQWLLSALVQVWVEKSPRYWDGVRRGREDDENGSIAMMKMMMIGCWDWLAANREGILGCVDMQLCMVSRNGSHIITFGTHRKLRRWHPYFANPDHRNDCGW